MTDFRGLTWDHPRGREALETAAARFSAQNDDSLAWDVQPLEGFESSPIAELAERYDLIVLDHPHLGDALASGCLQPLDQLFGAAELQSWADAAVGPSAASYVMEGRPWALPLDAATQVAASRPDLVGDAPRTWGDAVALADGGLVAPSLAGPHAFLSLCSLAVSLGDDPGASPEQLLARDIGVEALGILQTLADRAPAGTHDLNPIGLLELMSSGDTLGYVPLVYGYVTYASPTRPRPLAFGSPPGVDGRLGSTLGGTGIAVTRRRVPSPALLDHLRWLMSATAQQTFIPQHAGQPSARAAWLDPAVDAAAGGFYSGTLAATEAAWVRPRFAGYIPFQAAASALIRDALRSGAPPESTLDALDELLRRSRATASDLERHPA